MTNHPVYGVRHDPLLQGPHGRLILLTGAAALLALGFGVLTGLVERRHTQRVMDVINTGLIKINEGDRSARLSEPGVDGQIACLVQNLNRTLDRCDRLRWFASDLSHELRTPLTGLRLELEDAGLHPGETDVPRLVGRAISSVDRLEGIVTGMLVLARMRAGQDEQREALDLGRLVRDEVGRRDDRLQPTLSLEDGVTVEVARDQIQQVITNLLNNAQRHACRSVAVEVRGDDGMACLSVADDGEGVPCRDRQRIFQRFTRLEESRRLDTQGAGLGLAITRDIAAAHAGTVHVEDSPCGGARFVFRVPMA
ncbi:sensor histidine kinase [Microbispora sp. NPDC049125]|uniref:sensor histidine kinase n=1 Tax=Microbispora sp. NPDC049125 TaxID=3154929 RepID=UPI0034657280